MTDRLSPVAISRRRLIASAAAAFGAAVVPFDALAGTGGLNIYNRHTREGYRFPLYVGGTKNEAVHPYLDYILRDHRENVSIRMDPRLYDMLYVIQTVAERVAGRDARVEVVSGYRTAKTNAMLSGRSEGVALNSYHVKGQAIDFVVTGVSPKTVARFLWNAEFGGVGLYGEDFCHADTGPRRRWGDSF